MSIIVIVELRAKPGRRAELKRVLENMIATHGPGQHGFLGSRHYEVLDDADLLVEIADWESAEARTAQCAKPPRPAPTHSWHWRARFSARSPVC